VRVFAAVVPPGDALQHLAERVDDVRREHPAVPLSWPGAGRWHLTLAFYGEVSDLQASRLAERLARAAARHDAMRLRFAGAGRFGDRVLWAGVEGDVAPLKSLAASAAAAGRRVGLDVEDRAYRPHLTLARGRPRARPDLKPLVAALADYDGPPWAADRLVLVRSHLGPTPRYVEQGAWPLAAGSTAVGLEEPLS
jgi:2'-5' RNA ligase